jgi:CHAD domain-containing protein
MAYALSLDAVGDSLRRAAREQLDAAAEGLNQPDDPVEAVHDARKRLKKTRALLRLARPAMPARTFRKRNRELRDQGRALSGARDADVLLETVDGLADRYSGRLPKARFTAARTRLARDRPEGVPEHDVPTLAARSDGWPVDAVDAATLTRALATTYERGRKAFAEADAGPTMENLHAWRKRVKDLWYQQKLLKRVWPDVMDALAGEAKALSKLLGEDHDLAVLAAELPDDDALAPLIEHRRAELLEQARSLGRRVYAESPKAFRKRVRSYVRAVA